MTNNGERVERRDGEDERQRKVSWRGAEARGGVRLDNKITGKIRG